MYVEEELDAGAVILQEETEITDEDTFLSLHDRLKDIGAENFDVAFICIADIEASVMIALNLKELGVKTIIAKAINKKHGKRR